MKRISIDVTFNQLKNLGSVEHLQLLFDGLYHHWVGEYKEREDNVRIGSLDVYKNEDGNIVMEFITRFAI